MTESMIFYRSFYEALKLLPTDEDKVEALISILELGLNGTDVTPDSPAPAVVYVMAKPQILANHERRGNGSKGGRPKKLKTIGFENENHRLLNEKPNVNVNVNVNDNDNDNENENDIEIGKDTSVPTKRPSKHKHGEYKHVLLTDEEKEKLYTEYGQCLTDNSITFLDEYIEMKGYKAKSHYLAIRKWVVDAVKERERKKNNNGNQGSSRLDWIDDVEAPEGWC